MPESPRRPTNRGATAGSLILGSVVLCTAVGAGLGALVGAAVPLGLAGLFVGGVVGVAVVIRSFRDL